MTLGPLTASETRWLDHIRSRIVGRLEGDDAERARAAALVAWWALKEGILDLPNPLRHNLCTAAGERQIGDLQVCPSGAWQIGLSGIQGGAVTLAQAEAVARRLYPGESVERILERTAIEAGVEGSAVDQIRTSTGALRKAWLLRDGSIGFTLQRPFVERGCGLGAQGSGLGASWCFGGWDTARRFASSPERAREVVRDLESRFGGAPTPGGGALAIALGLAAIGGLGYWAWRTGRLDVNALGITRSRHA